MNLFENPFYILGASTRDDRKQILDLAQDKMLQLDTSVVSEAKLMLTTPSKRINAEISWLPGISKSKCKEIMQFLTDKQTDLSIIGSLPPLPAINVRISMLTYWDNLQKAPFINFIHTIAAKYEEISVENLTTILNEERSVAKMPEISNPSVVEQALEAHKNYCVEQLQHLLDKLPTKRLTANMLALVENCIKQEESLSLIDTLIDKSYAIKVQPYLLEQSEKIKESAKKIEKLLSDNPQSQSIDENVEEFIEELSVFDEAMQPLQLSMQQRGLEHQESRDIAYVARGLAIDLLNKAQKEELSEKLMKKVKELFTEISSVDEKVDKDLNDLKEIQDNRKEWEEEVTCSIKEWSWGTRTLNISPKGISVDGGRLYKLEEINSIRFGVTQNYTNGVHTSTDTRFAFGTENHGAEEITWLGYSNGNWQKAVDCLWRAVGVKIMMAMARKLANGDSLYGVIYDKQVLLAKTHWYTPTEKRLFSWDDVVIYSQNGFFVIANKHDRSWSAAFSYQYDQNTHVIDRMIHIAFKSGADTISGALGITKEDAKKGTQLYFGPEKNLDSYGFIFTWIFTIAGAIVLLVLMAGG